MILKSPYLAFFLLMYCEFRTVNFSELAQSFKSKVQSGSFDKRLQQFLHDFEIDYRAIAQLVAELMNIPPTLVGDDRPQ
jgi:hypothetical protein